MYPRKVNSDIVNMLPITSYTGPIELIEVSELGCLGAAMCAGIGAGLYKDASEAVDKCVHIKEVYTPNQDNVKTYQETFERWFECLKITNNQIYV